MAALNLQEIINKNKSIAKNNNQKGATETAEHFAVSMIPVEKLHSNVKNLYGMRDVESLADSIELLGGIKQNLLVREREDGDYDIVAGHKRKAAAQMLVDNGKTEYRLVPCKVENYNKRAEQMEKAAGEEETADPQVIEELDLIFTNTTQRQQTIQERAKAVARLKALIPQVPGMENVKGRVLRKLIAETLKISEGSVAAVDNINKNLCTAAALAFGDDKINFETAKELAGLKEYEQLRCLSLGYTAKQIKDYKKEREESKLKLNAEELAMLYNRLHMAEIIGTIRYERAEAVKKIKKALKDVLSEENDNYTLEAKETHIQATDKYTGEFKTISYEVIANQIIKEYDTGKLAEYIKNDEKLNCNYERVLFMQALTENARTYGGNHADLYNGYMSDIRAIRKNRYFEDDEREEKIQENVYKIIFEIPTHVTDIKGYLRSECLDRVERHPDHKTVCFMNPETEDAVVKLYDSTTADQPVKIIEYKNLIRFIGCMSATGEYREIITTPRSENVSGHDTDSNNATAWETEETTEQQDNKQLQVDDYPEILPNDYQKAEPTAGDNNKIFLTDDNVVNILTRMMRETKAEDERTALKIAIDTFNKARRA